jgi:hypothetical protein
MKEQSVKTADLKPIGANGYRWPSYLSGQERGVSHHGQELFSTERPDTLTQTFPHPSTFPLQSAGGPYIAPEPLELPSRLAQADHVAAS